MAVGLPKDAFMIVTEIEGPAALVDSRRNAVAQLLHDAGALDVSYSDLEDELSQKILITEGGRELTITKQRGMLKSLFAKALKGDVRAANALINLILGLEQSRLASGEAGELDDDDLAILEAFKSRILKDAKELGET